MTTANNTTTHPTEQFWATLQPTRQQAACPNCGQNSLEVRKLRDRGRTWQYVRCCGYPQIVHTGK